MNLPLNRIEQEYIIEILKKEKPPIFMFGKNVKQKIASQNYTFSENTLIFKPKTLAQLQIVSQEKIEIVFPHRGRKMHFFSSLQKNKNCFTVIIPNEIYKFNPQKKIHTTNFLRLKLFNSKELYFDQTNDFALFVQQVSHKTLSAKFKMFFKKTVHYIDLPDPKKYNDALLLRIQDFLLLIKKTNNIKILEMLFVDEKSILVVLKANQVLSKKNLNFYLKINGRIINGTINQGFFLPISEQFTLIAFYFQNISTEDKRFLFESTHHGKYIP